MLFRSWRKTNKTNPSPIKPSANAAQDDLNTLGFRTGGLDGVFGAQTYNAVRSYQTSRGLTVDGIIGCNTWRSLQENVVGTGATNTTIN